MAGDMAISSLGLYQFICHRFERLRGRTPAISLLASLDDRFRRTASSSSRMLAVETISIVPRKRSRIWVELPIARGLDASTVERVVVAAVLELLADATTHGETQVRRHRHIARIE